MLVSRRNMEGSGLLVTHTASANQNVIHTASANQNVTNKILWAKPERVNAVFASQAKA